MRSTLDLVREELEPKVGTLDLFSAEEVNAAIRDEDINGQLDEAFTHAELGNVTRNNFKLLKSASETYRYSKAYLPFIQIYERRLHFSDENEMRIYFMTEDAQSKLETMLFERYEKAMRKIWEYWENQH